MEMGRRPHQRKTSACVTKAGGPLFTERRLPGPCCYGKAERPGSDGLRHWCASPLQKSGLIRAMDTEDPPEGRWEGGAGGEAAEREAIRLPRSLKTWGGDGVAVRTAGGLRGRVPGCGGPEHTRGPRRGEEGSRKRSLGRSNGRTEGGGTE